MHVSGIPLDLHWFLQFIFTSFIVFLGLLHLVKNTASRYFVVDGNFEEEALYDRQIARDEMLEVAGNGDACVVCCNSGKKICSGCRRVRYCSQTCQRMHWQAGHKTKCEELKLFGDVNSKPSVTTDHGRRASSCMGKYSTSVSLVPGGGTCKILHQPKKVLFPYDEFVNLFNWDKPGFPPCGLLNCGNSCFANVVLQCLASTRPLMAFLLEKAHRRECRRNDWCFLCELQIHVERASQSLHPFSPINILSRLPNIGGNLGYGKQEDAHEFMRFAIDTMQSVCLDEFGGEKAVHPNSQETTLIQHIFGGHLQSQVICSKCKKISNRYENMMDLTVEIQGDAASLEDCLEQFTVKEWLHGENMYKCDGCNDYVKAWKRLTIRQAPNILTIALKRFQTGRFGKLNKRVTFPETLDLGPYMSEVGDGADLYRLYAVVVHVDMLNASYFGHYICYTKDFGGNWYRVDDCKVVTVELDEVLNQGAYMLLYSRIRARPLCVKSLKPSMEEQLVEVAREEQPSPQQPIESFTLAESIIPVSVPGFRPSDISSHSPSPERGLSFRICSDVVREDQQDMDLDNSESCSSSSIDLEGCSSERFHAAEIALPVELAHRRLSGLASSSETSSIEAHSLERELSCTNSDAVCGFQDGNGVRSNCDKELKSSEFSIDCSLSSQNGVQEMAETSLTVSLAASSSVTGALDETNPASCQCLPNPRMEQVVVVKSGKRFSTSRTTEASPSKLDGESSCSRAKLKPLFSPGFLGKRTKNRSLTRDGKSPLEPSEVGPSCMVNSSCNGFAKPGFPQKKNGKVNGHCEFPLDCDSLLTPSFVDDQSEKCLNQDKMANGESGEAGYPCNCECNGDAETVIINSDVECGFQDRNGVRSSCDKEFMSSESSADGSVSSQNGFQEMAQTSHNIFVAASGSLKETLDETNPASCPSLRNPRLVQAALVKSGEGTPTSRTMETTTSKLAGESSCSGAKLKPVFSPGFLGKHTRSRSLKADGNASIETIEVGPSCKGNSNCNGFAKPSFPQRNYVKVNEHGEIPLDCDSLLTSPSFSDYQSEKRLIQDKITNKESGGTGYPCNSDCNGDAESVIVDQCGSNIYDTDTGQARRYSENPFIDYGSSLHYPCFLDKPLGQKSSNKDEECQELSETVHPGEIEMNNERMADERPAISCQKRKDFCSDSIESS